MIHLTRAKLLQSGVTLHDFGLERLCAGCGAKFPGAYGDCHTCGPSEVVIACARCGNPTRGAQVQYSATGPDDVSITKELSADECPSCGHLHIWSQGPDHLDELATMVPPGFRLIPEHGYQTNTYLEVFSFIGHGVRSTIRKKAGEMAVRYGRQSSIFQRAANDITELDLDDHGLTEYPTVRIRPPPPYSAAQLRTLRLLLAQVSQELDDEYWEADETVSALLAVIMRWSGDEDRRALALASAIRKREHPGVFVNTYRLLELVLERLIDADLARKRRDTTVSDREFVDLAKGYRAELKTRIKRRVAALPSFPSKILSELWHLLRPGEPLNLPKVFHELADFRNSHVHPPHAEEREAVLPWEAPDFERLSQVLMELTIFILRNDPGGIGDGSKVREP